MKILPSSGIEPGKEGQAPGPSAAPRGRVGGGSEELKKWSFPKERETPPGQGLQTGINAFRAYLGATSGECSGPGSALLSRNAVC